jgi:hypothetical protein
MKNVGIAYAAVAAISLGSGCQTLADRFDTEREMGQSVPGSRCRLLI